MAEKFEDQFINISCLDTSDDDDSIFLSKWKGAFTNSLLTGSHKLSKGSLLDLKMKVSSAEETSESYRQIVFSSTCFESSVTGIWKTDKGKIKIIDISDPRVSPDKIFLEFD